MRMWKVNPRKMCRQHLLGEHLEMHMFLGCVKNKIKLTGYLKNGLVEIHNIKKRHDELVKEMKRRGYNHKTKCVSCSLKRCGRVNSKANKIELARRCKECRKLQAL